MCAGPEHPEKRESSSVRLLRWAGGCSGLGFHHAMGNVCWQLTRGSCEHTGMSKLVKVEPNQLGFPFTCLDIVLNESQTERNENTKAF